MGDRSKEAGTNQDLTGILGAKLAIERDVLQQVVVERLLGEANRDLALDGLEKTAIAAGIGTTTAHTSRAQRGLPPTSPTAARSSTRRKWPRTVKLYDCAKARLTQELMCIEVEDRSIVV